VAEDNETNLKVISHQLRMLGFASVVAVDGAEALERWRVGDIDMLLTDLHMPTMDGYELAAAIRAEEAGGRRTPILALTANALAEEEARCLEAGMDCYLTKPIRIQQLEAAIAEWLPVHGAAASGAAPAGADLPPADLQVLQSLVGDDPDIIRDMLLSFRQSALQARTELNQAAAGRSAELAAAAAHKLKGAARTVGAERLGLLCEQIEEAAGAANLDRVNASLSHFERELNAVLDFFEAADTSLQY
jgi:CheY-like chemotaxis protein